VWIDVTKGARGECDKVFERKRVRERGYTKGTRRGRMQRDEHNERGVPGMECQKEKDLRKER
jgi:hypothetical protein